jgi:isoamylase
MAKETRISEGSPFPLGATWDGLGVNFALFSAHATKVELVPVRRQRRNRTRAHRTARITPTRSGTAISRYRPGAVYGYRVHGRYEPEAGHRFNPNKLLLDPYAKAHVGGCVGPGVFGYTLDATATT